MRISRSRWHNRNRGVMHAPRTVQYKGLLFTAWFIFHRNIMENGPGVRGNAHIAYRTYILRLYRFGQRAF